MIPGARVLGLAVALALPQMASACGQISQHVWMCYRDTPWETAQWDQYGDGATLVLGDLTFNFSEDYPGSERRNSDASTLEEQFEAYAEFAKSNESEPLEIIEKSVIETDRMRALHFLQRDLIDGAPSTSAQMLAQIGTARIMLFLDAPETMPMAEMDIVSREVLAMLYDSCADAVSCAEDYQPSQTAQKE